jgi:hypothetical protein
MVIRFFPPHEDIFAGNARRAAASISVPGYRRRAAIRYAQ